MRSPSHPQRVDPSLTRHPGTRVLDRCVGNYSSPALLYPLTASCRVRRDSRHSRAAYAPAPAIPRAGRTRAHPRARSGTTSPGPSTRRILPAALSTNSIVQREGRAPWSICAAPAAPASLPASPTHPGSCHGLVRIHTYRCGRPGIAAA